MHIVWIHRGVFPERTGGTYTYIHELGRRLVARGHRIDIIASTRASTAGPPTEVEGMRVHRYAFRRVNPVYSTLQHLAKTSAAYSAIAGAGRVDVLGVHDSHLGYKVARSALGRTACQLPTFHAPSFLEFRFNTGWQIAGERSALRRMALRLSEPPLEFWQRRLEVGVLEAARGIVVLSQCTRALIEAHFPSVDVRKVKVIPSGVETDRFRPAEDKMAVRRELGLESDAIHLLTVRKLAPRMGLENLLRAMSTVLASDAARGTEIRLTICGSGPLMPILEALIGDLGIGGSVDLVGEVTDGDLVKYYQAADLFVLPTAALEGFGISTIEALSVNVPVVGTPAGATPEILGRIDERLLTRDTSADGIAAAIVAWLGWRESDSGSMRYRDEVLARYSWESVTDAVEEYYEEERQRFERERNVR